MTSYELLFPLITLLAGLLFMMALEVGGGEDAYVNQRRVHAFALLLSFIQQVLLYRLPPALFLRGGMVLDGVSQLLSLSILGLALMMQQARKHDQSPLRSQTEVLTLGATLLAVFAVQTNRYLFGVLALTGLVWSAHGAFATDGDRKRQSENTHSGVIRGLMALTVGVFLALLCFSVFGETQINEIQRIMIRAAPSETVLFAIQIFIIFLAAFCMGIPPAQGLFGASRVTGTWPLALGLSGMLAIVGLGLFLRWGILVFSRVAVGANELEPLTQTSIFEAIRWISCVALVLCPAFALMQRRLRGSLTYFLLIPFVQILFAISFGQREVFGFAMGQVIIIIILLGLIVNAVQSLGLPEEFTIKDCIGLGRRDMPLTLLLLFGLMAAAGLSPFYGSMLLQKTLCINTWYGIFLLVNLSLSGYYVARLTAVVFQKPANAESPTKKISLIRKLTFSAQFLLLIFLGIFWQPLYKYGAFSIRSFFGDI
jgi:NADH:ubiquinone oxidoreductase subunit 2 (subunit N)